MSELNSALPDPQAYDLQEKIIQGLSSKLNRLAFDKIISRDNKEMLTENLKNYALPCSLSQLVSVKKIEEAKFACFDNDFI